jgi:hypothetical protein
MDSEIKKTLIEITKNVGLVDRWASVARELEITLHDSVLLSLCAFNSMYTKDKKQDIKELKKLIKQALHSQSTENKS